MSDVYTVSAEALRQIINRLMRLEEERANLMGAIKDVYAEAKNQGFEPKIIRMIMRDMKMQDHERQEIESLLDVYRRALGITSELEDNE